MTRRFPRKLTASLIICVLTFFQLLPGPAEAAGTAAISVDVVTQTVVPRQQFVINIGVNPNYPIAGAQFNLSFNSALVTVDVVTEGNLLRQGGAKTYFTGGQVDNQGGMISGVAGVIVGAGQTVSAAGTFAVITMTAKSTTGTCPLNLSNVVVGDVKGSVVPTNIINGQVAISTANSPPVLAPIGSGGFSSGAGGVSGSPVEPGVANLTIYTGAEGVFNIEGRAESADGLARLTFAPGAKAQAKDGTALKSVSIMPKEDTLPSTTDARALGLTYEFGPEGAHFSPGITLTFVLDRKTLPADIALESLRIGLWDGTKWEIMDGLIDPETMTISVQVSHFSAYGVLSVTLAAVSPLAPTPALTQPATSNTIDPGAQAPVQVEIAAASTEDEAVSKPASRTAEEPSTTDLPSDDVPESRTFPFLLFGLGVCLTGATSLLLLGHRRVLLKKGRPWFLRERQFIASNVMTLDILQCKDVSVTEFSNGDCFTGVIRDARPQVAGKPLIVDHRSMLDNCAESVDQESKRQNESEKDLIGDHGRRLDTFTKSVVEDLKPRNESEEHIVNIIVSRLSRLGRLSWTESDPASAK